MEMKLQIVISGDQFSPKRLMKRSACKVIESTDTSCVITHKTSERDPLNWARKFLKRNHRWLSNADIDVQADEELNEFWSNVFKKEEYPESVS